MGNFFNLQRIALVIVSLFVTAVAGASDCKILMSVSDSGASVYIDGKLAVQRVGSRPVALDCSSARQRVKVVSSDRQEFSRVMPAASEFGSSRVGKWNVNFRGAGGGPLGVAGENHVSVENDQAAVLRELAVLRQMVQSLLAARGSSGSSSSLRSPASVGSGFFVQILSVPTVRAGYLHLDRGDTRAIARSRKSGHDVRIMKCEWSKDASLTRVMVGPLSSQHEADQFAHAVGRDSFVVVDPACGS